MAKVTWRATAVGACVLFLIGVAIATAGMYAKVALKSINAHLEGPLTCDISPEIIRSKRKCNETRDEFVETQECIYVFVSYTNEETEVTTDNIKLAMSYDMDHREDDLVDPIFNPYNETCRSQYRKCSADYCGTYRFRKEVINSTSYTETYGDYHLNPPLIATVDAARLENNGSGTVSCFLNRLNPSKGAYLYLNYEVFNAYQRMFRYYEGWIIISTPPIITLCILIMMAAVFIRGDLTKDLSEKNKKEIFVPPGLMPIIHRDEHSLATPTRSSRETGIKEETETLVNHLSV